MFAAACIVNVMLTLAEQNYYPDLEEYALRKLQQSAPGFDDTGMFSREDPFIAGNRLYLHPRVRINWTSYDVRRTQHTISPKYHPDFMVLISDEPSEDDEPHMTEPYLCGRALQIGHVMVRIRGDVDFQRIDFVYTRCYMLEEKGSWLEKRPPRLAFIPADEPGDFGFVDLTDIIGAVNMLPDLETGTSTHRLLDFPTTFARIFEHYGDNILQSEDYENVWLDI